MDEVEVEADEWEYDVGDVVVSTTTSGMGGISKWTYEVLWRDDSYVLVRKESTVNNAMPILLGVNNFKLKETQFEVGKYYTEKHKRWGSKRFNVVAISGDDAVVLWKEPNYTRRTAGLIELSAAPQYDEVSGW